MTILFACPKCKGKLTVADDQAGSKFPCPTCGQRLQVPIPPPPVRTDKTMVGDLLLPELKTLQGEVVLTPAPAPAVLSPTNAPIAQLAQPTASLPQASSSYTQPASDIGAASGQTVERTSALTPPVPGSASAHPFNGRSILLRGISLAKRLTWRETIAITVISSLLVVASCGGLASWLFSSRADSSNANKSGKEKQKPTPSQPKEPMSVVAAETLLEDYFAELAADQKYLGKTFVLSGVVASTQKLEGGGAGVTVVPALNEFGLYSKRVNCFFSNRSEAAKIESGRYLSLVGTCKGLDSKVRGHVVRMDNCRLATDEEIKKAR